MRDVVVFLTMEDGNKKITFRIVIYTLRIII